MNTKDTILKAFDPNYITETEVIETKIDNLPKEQDIDNMSNEELDKLINQLH